jgi:hypothetical protein
MLLGFIVSEHGIKAKPGEEIDDHEVRPNSESKGGTIGHRVPHSAQLFYLVLGG